MTVSNAWKTAAVALSALLAGVLIWVALFWQPAPPTSSVAPLPEFMPPGTIDFRPTTLGGEFVLDAAEGSVKLSQFRDKIVLIYFGYTFCPDACPTNLAIMSAAFGLMDEEELGEVQGVFVSVDPERDTPERLAEYTGFFHPQIIGITGTPERVAEVARRYGVAYQRSEAQSAGGYLVDHSSYIYVVAPDGKLEYALPHAAPPEVIVETVRMYLSRNKP
ncbi:MAG: hypothetical protein Kow006_05070 [Gammaproteobacteria bacterium]